MSNRLILWFDVVNSPSLSPEDIDLNMSRNGNRIGRDGVLRVMYEQTFKPGDESGTGYRAFH